MKWISLSVLLMLMVQPTIKNSIFIWYQLNKSEIIQELCENKDTPMMHCDGKCVLAKKIKATEGNRENSPAVPSSLLEEIDPTTLVENDYLVNRSLHLIENSFGSFVDFYSSNYSKDIFHPPTAC